MASRLRRLLGITPFFLVFVAQVVPAQTEEIVLNSTIGCIREDGQPANSMMYLICGRSESMRRYRIAGVAHFIANMPQASKLRVELSAARFYGNETFDVYSVDTKGTTSPSFFEDLGTGTVFGPTTVSLINGVLTIELNEAAVAAFNSVPRSKCYYEDGDYWCQNGWFEFALSVREPFATASGLDGMTFEKQTGHRLVVTPVALAVEPTTWGSVKALYRN